MSTREENTKSGRDWSDDPRLTAYALGELEPDQSAELEAEMAGDAGARSQVEELRALAGTLQGHFAAENAPELTPEQREVIEARIDSADESASSTPVHRMELRRYASLAATFLIIGVGGWAIYRMDGGASMAPAERLARADGASTGQDVGQIQGGRIIATTDGQADGFVMDFSNPQSISGMYGPGADQSIKAIKKGFGSSTGSPVVGVERLRSLGYATTSEGGKFRGRGVQALPPREDGIVLDSDHLVPTPGNREAYDRIYENPFLSPQSQPQSTFSIDVDTASYANVRRMIEDGHLPPADAVRIEEMVNYFPYAYPAADGEHPFSVNVEVGSAPWAPSHRLVRIGLKGKETLPAERRASNLVFLMDVSGSMGSPDKLPLLKQALHMLVQELDERDTVSIVVYAGASGLALPATRCDRSVDVHMALERLNAGGSTNGGAGIELAYRVAADNFIDGGINRVILATDGDFNVGVSDDGSLVRMIEEKAKTGVFLSVLGFGRGNLQDSKMEKLADKGNGNYSYIDSVMEARKVLVVQMGSTLETIAKDVKIQVDFNPTEVAAYRLIGYENRLLAAQDFNDDTKDAGEIGAGHCVTALYEVVPVGVEIDLPKVDPSRYQASASASPEAFTGELMFLKLRYKQPDSDTSTLLTTPIVDTGADFQELSSETRWAAAVAGFGMVLRESQHKGTLTLEDVSRWALESGVEDPGGYRAQFIGLVGKARALRQR
jgi:Ca-activated chloride channel family protein